LSFVFDCAVHIFCAINFFKGKRMYCTTRTSWTHSKSANHYTSSLLFALKLWSIWTWSSQSSYCTCLCLSCWNGVFSSFIITSGYYELQP